LRSVALLALASKLLFGAADTTTAPKKSTPAPATKSKATSKSKTTGKSQTTGTSKTEKSSAPGKAAAKTTARTKSTGKSSKTASKHGKKSNSASAATWRSRQLAPTPERYKEIQSALVERGYLKKDASGVWDTDSADALRRFQQDQNLEATGKLNSLSLIALGLGPKHTSPAPAAAAPHTPPAAQPPVTTPPASSPATPAPEPPAPAPPTQPAPTQL